MWVHSGTEWATMCLKHVEATSNNNVASRTSRPPQGVEVQRLGQRGVRLRKRGLEEGCMLHAWPTCMHGVCQVELQGPQTLLQACRRIGAPCVGASVETVRSRRRILSTAQVEVAIRHIAITEMCYLLSSSKVGRARTPGLLLCPGLGLGLSYPGDRYR